jgi:hypothetical protein
MLIFQNIMMNIINIYKCICYTMYSSLKHYILKSILDFQKHVLLNHRDKNYLKSIKTYYKLQTIIL